MPQHCPFAHAEQRRAAAGCTRSRGEVRGDMLRRALLHAQLHLARSAAAPIDSQLYGPASRSDTAIWRHAHRVRRRPTRARKAQPCTYYYF